MEKVNKTSYKEKEVKKLPKGAKVLSKDTSVAIEEIENGFLITRSSDIRYEVKGSTDYMYITNKYFSKTNPLTIDLAKIPLADKIGD